MDIHSFSRPDLTRVRHIDLDLEVDFDRRVLRGVARLDFAPAASGEIVLDTRDLSVTAVEHQGGEADFELGTRDAVLGAPLRIALPAGATWVRVHYCTAPGASALQWCAPEQTAGQRHPFLYTQSQAIHARSWIPLQDSPGVRVTFDARIRTPPGLLAVMGAEMDIGAQRTGEYRFRMPQAVPPYLIALAAGDLAFRSLGPRSGVYAEPAVVDAAAFEFADIEAMMAAVEDLYGPYRWGRYDVLVLPPSFPFGGMENPRLTFATPTILAGDRSLVSLVAHELAHSWSGNLVTNATWSDFWLNEGFTVYVERRILEKLYGERRARMESVLARGELMREMALLHPPDQVLHVDLEGRDPDAGCTLVPYEKGYLLLLALGQAAGRERFDAFLRRYFDRFAFQSITTAEFVQYLERELPNLRINLEEWLTQPGIPPSAPQADTRVFDDISNPAPGWSTHEWLHFLRTTSLPLDELDVQYNLTQAQNAEILHQWLLMAIRSGYEPAYRKLEEFLLRVGRRKFVKLLYAEMLKTSEGRARAESIYKKARPAYHPIAQATIDEMLNRNQP